jgi:hypothetical protein
MADERRRSLACKGTSEHGGFIQMEMRAKALAREALLLLRGYVSYVCISVTTYMTRIT